MEWRASFLHISSAQPLSDLPVRTCRLYSLDFCFKVTQNSKDATPLPSGFWLCGEVGSQADFWLFWGFPICFCFCCWVFCLFVSVCEESLLYVWNKKVSPCEIQMLGSFNEFCFAFLSRFDLKVHFSFAQESFCVFTASFPFALPSWHVYKVPLDCSLSPVFLLPSHHFLVLFRSLTFVLGTGQFLTYSVYLTESVFCSIESVTHCFRLGC